MGKKNRGNKFESKAPTSHQPKIHKQQPEKAVKGRTGVEQKTKGKSLFQIVPDNDGEDAFAALGYDKEQKELSEEEVLNGEEEDESFEDEQQDDQIGDDDQIEEEGDQQIQDQEEQFGSEGDEDREEVDQQGDEVEDEEIDEDDIQDEEDPDCDAPPLEGEEEGNAPVDASVISLQIQQTINILMNVVKLGEGKPRKHFVDKLRQLLHQYYGYNYELIDHFLSFFNPTELVQLFEANETQRPLTIRTNTLKTRRKQLAQNLIQRGVNLDPLAEWSKVGIKIYESKVPIGATPEYLAGHYMLQSASSFLPVLALDPQPGDRVLDLSAAPGGKTTYIAQLMKNTGCIFANDLKKERLKALHFNLLRLGITNTVVTCRDGRKYPQLFPGSFDRVLLDAPCTGLGIISKDHSIKANRLLIDIYKNSHVQKELLLAAVDCTRVGGTTVYSTCSISPLENEEVVNYVLKKRFVRVVETEIEVGEEGLTKFCEKRYHNDLKKTRRIYPHVHNMDGFYVARLVKTGKGKRKLEGEEEKPEA